MPFGNLLSVSASNHSSAGRLERADSPSTISCSSTASPPEVIYLQGVAPAPPSAVAGVVPYNEARTPASSCLGPISERHHPIKRGSLAEGTRSELVQPRSASYKRGAPVRSNKLITRGIVFREGASSQYQPPPDPRPGLLLPTINLRT